MKNEELILLVDDDPGNLKHAQTILGEEFRISATTSGKMAVSLLDRIIPDLILLDVNMPEMDGFQTLAAIREKEGGENIPVVFLTADSDASTETRCFEAGPGQPRPEDTGEQEVSGASGGYGFDTG